MFFLCREHSSATDLYKSDQDTFVGPRKACSRWERITQYALGWEAGTSCLGVVHKLHDLCRPTRNACR